MQPITFPKRNPDWVVPNDSQCPVCTYFDITHPDVVRVLTSKDPSKRTWHLYQCRCPMIQREKESRDELRRQQANLPHQHSPRTFETWQANPETDAAYNAAYEFARGQGPHVLVLQGLYGTGKSHLLEAIIRYTLDRERTARYELTSSFLDRLRHTHNDDSEEDLWDLLQWYQRMYLLVLDDVGIGRPTPFSIEKLTEVVDERLREGRRLAIATNHNKEEMGTWVHPRTASRLFPEHGENEVVVAYLSGGDKR